MGDIKDHTRLENFKIQGPWYNHNSIAIVLKIKEVQKVCCINMGISIEPVIFVRCLDGSIMKLKDQTSGIYIFKPNINTSVSACPHCTLVTTLEENKYVFTKIQVSNAEIV